MIQAWPLVFGVSMTCGPRSLYLAGRLSTHRFGGSLMCPSAEIARYCMPFLLAHASVRVHLRNFPQLDEDAASSPRKCHSNDTLPPASPARQGGSVKRSQNLGLAR